MRKKRTKRFFINLEKLKNNSNSISSNSYYILRNNIKEIPNNNHCSSEKKHYNCKNTYVKVSNIFFLPF